MINLLELDPGQFKDQSHAEIHKGADRREVVERHKRVHLVLCRAEESLHHNQSNGLEDDATNLEENPDQDKLDLTDGSNDDADDNDGDIEQDLEIWPLNAHGPAREEDGYWCASLENQP